MGVEAAKFLSENKKMVRWLSDTFIEEKICSGNSETDCVLELVYYKYYENRSHFDEW